VAFVRWVGWRESSPSRAAGHLGLSPATLERWCRRWRQDRMAWRPRGRRVGEVDRDTLRGILAMFDLMGPHASVAALRDLFPEVPRASLEGTLRRARRIFRRRQGWLLYTLRWTRPGTVWATDFTEPPAPVDGEYNRVLLVRDLASGRQMLALPCKGESTEVVLPSLQHLFARHGPPLVLKSDNGSAFIAKEVQARLQQSGVFSLLSPPRTPEYNGSIEAGIGSLEVRAFYESARHDRPGLWTSDDLAAATRQANEITRPAGLHGATPEQAWRVRVPLDKTEREAFESAYERHYMEEWTRRGVPVGSGPPPGRWASVDRVAISRALIERGFLLVRRRRITPPITARKWRRIA
jgi:transposase InsO family protein